MPHLSALHIHPVKAARALSPTCATVEPWGLTGDRRWMITDTDGRFLSQREEPRLALLSVRPTDDGGLLLGGATHDAARTSSAHDVDLSGSGSGSGPGRAAAAARPAAPQAPATAPRTGGTAGRAPAQLAVARPASEQGGGRTVQVTVWSDTVTAVPAALEADAWLSELLGRPVRLVHLDDPARRRAPDPRYASPDDRVTFADGFPLLATTTSSLAALNALIAGDDGPDAEQLPMNRFRPNVVVDGTEPWAEDRWRRIRIGPVVFRVAKPCGRCVVTTTDQETARRGRQPLRALARHRRIDGSLVFGQNLIPDLPPADPGAFGHPASSEPGRTRPARIRLGDTVTVLETS